MSSSGNPPIPNWTNPLQNNNAALMAIGYIAGICAAKFTFFDLQTWNYIIFTGGGVAFAAVSYFLNRKSAVVATVANMTEVKTVELDKTVTGVKALENITPNNVVVSK